MAFKFIIPNTTECGLLERQIASPEVHLISLVMAMKPHASITFFYPTQAGSSQIGHLTCPKLAKEAKQIHPIPVVECRGCVRVRISSFQLLLGSLATPDPNAMTLVFVMLNCLVPVALQPNKLFLRHHT